MSTSLTTKTTLGLMPLAIGILLRHYYDRVLKDKNKSKNGEGAAVLVPLRQEELMYDEAFTITRNFMDSATNHTVEELQQFTQMHTPAGPSSHVVRLTVPQTCCAEAARVLVRVFGGEHEARRVVGGVRWWQVRPGDGGIDAEWIMDKRDWKEAKRREKAAAAAAEKSQAFGESGSGSGSSFPQSTSSPSGVDTQASTGDMEANAYPPEMDEMRCLLWAHGGGYYFGSVDQERYMIQRYARKMHGRVFVPKYRLAPQYPFPCALQDLLASYLFLIDPPPGAAHCPVKPSHIVVGGDSSGGGLALAFLQVVRDSGLPPPAGGVLISPWCDLHHAFPSIFLNTDTDIVPATGLTLYKPSPLWPPPPHDVNRQVNELLRSSARNRSGAAVVPPGNDDGNRITATPVIPPDDTVMRVTGEDGATVEIPHQIQLYTTNDLLIHPLVSPVLAYLGGLPPLFVVASDREVLRDEIVYTAHRAANPEKYPVSDAVKKLYPAYEGIESRMKPTTVHLQIYDDAAHVLPMMFMVPNPTKYCYRAITTFIKHVTNMPPTTALQKHKPPMVLQTSDFTPGEMVTSPVALSPAAEDNPPPTVPAPPSAPTRPTLRPTRFSRMTSSIRRGSSFFSKSSKGTPGVGHTEDEHAAADVDVLAGDPVVYNEGWAKAESPEHDSNRTMIRERVAIHGVVRPLESEPDLPALHVDPAHIGIVSARWARVYLAGMQRHEKKYASRMRLIARRRERAIALLRLQPTVGEAEKEAETEGEGWSVAWALDVADEHPPPSSLVARCDTVEALALVRAAAAMKLKRKRNARLAAAKSVSVSLRGTRKRRTSDEEEKGKKAVHSRPGGEFWRRLRRSHVAAPVTVAAAATATAQVVVAA